MSLGLDALLPFMRIDDAGLFLEAHTGAVALGALYAAVVGHLFILPLAGRPGHFAVHAVCKESVFWETLQQLKGAGASAILVVPIEKMMM